MDEKQVSNWLPCKLSPSETSAARNKIVSRLLDRIHEMNEGGA